ncbi:MAG: SLC26A/SulP transporter family protein [Magnetococcales bacterium]|nr:SLC26A/SulP transporter family protein [Magnetococcales bacterium]MBF0156609.1 SLC26A/SulP transporter family protein [Magnetococcales bacterium]
MIPRLSSWIGDAWGGMAAMLVALPSAIAFGVVAFTPLGQPYLPLGAMAGVVGVVVLGLITPALGGAPRLITAPCAPAAAVLASLGAERLASGAVSPEEGLLFLTMVGLMSGLLQLLYGGIGGGRIIKFIPYTVVTGYLSGVGFLIFLGQLPKLLGLPSGIPLQEGLLHPDHWQGTGILVGLVTIVAVVAAPRITRKLPAPVFGLVAGLGSYFLASLHDPALRQLADNPLLIGAIHVDAGSLADSFQRRWLALGEFRLGDLFELLVPALTLSVLLSVDTLKTCVVVDALTRSRHNSNRELMAQGVGNLATTLAGGMPGAGTMGATLVSINSGGRSRLAGMLEGFFSLLVLLFFSALIGWVPIAALAGILIVVAYRMVDWHSFTLLRRQETLLDFAVVATVVVTAVAFNLIAAAGAGVALSVMLFLREQVKSSVIRRKLHGGQLTSKRSHLPEEREVLEAESRKVVICELQGNLFFGTTDQLFSNLETDLGSCRYLLLDMNRVHSLDFTAGHLLGQIETTMAENGGCLIFSSLPTALASGRDLNTYLESLGLRPSAHLKIFGDINDALEWIEDRILDEYRTGEVVERPLLLSEIALFRGLEEETAGVMELLAGVIEERTFAAGEVLFQQGDTGDEMVLIRRGAIRVVLPTTDGRGHTLTIFGRGNFLGDMAFIDRAPRSTDAIAITEVEVFLLSRSRFDAVSQGYPEVAKKLFIRLCKTLTLRMRYANAEITALKTA